MNRINRLFDILLLLVNSVGIIGSLLEILELAPDRVIFWGGIFVSCVVAVLLWQGEKKKRIYLRVGICVLLYALLAVFFRKALIGGLYLALEQAVENLNRLEEYHIVWVDGAQLLREAGWPEAADAVFETLSLLFVCFPLELLAGYCWKRERLFCLAVGHVLWFAAACTFYVFPGVWMLAFCVTGTAMALVQKDFENSPKAGFLATLLITVMACLVLGVSYWFLLPGLDERYEKGEREREEFYRVVNEEWIPGLRSLMSGFGSGVDVTGALSRSNLFSYTALKTYRVTVSRRPQGTLYLRGFVGGVYEGKSWEAQSDRQLENYYRKHGLELPGNYGDLVNISYEAVGARTQQESSVETICIEELGGKGSYSLYPYGALMTKEFQVHGDGTVARKGEKYEFRYRFPAGNGRSVSLTGRWRTIEQQYRQYVYDNFLEYPAQQLPRLTECLEQEKIRTDDVYVCALDIMRFLSDRAVYDLDTGKNPQGTDFVEYFLFESHQGYCVHFASAGVLAFRYFGIPARYATGYVVSPSGFSGSDGCYTAELTGKQAHAWVEIYLDEVGWVPVEMTPGAVAFPEDNRAEMLASLDSWCEENLEATWGGATLLPTEPPQQEKEESSGKSEENMGNPEPEEEQSGEEQTAEDQMETEEIQATPESEEPGQELQVTGQGSKTFWAGGILMGGLLLGGGYLCVTYLKSLRKRRWRIAMQSAGTGERIFLLYGNLRKALDLVGCSGKLAIRGEEFWQKLTEACPETDREEYETFCDIMEKSTFGRSEPSQEELGMVCVWHDRLVGSVYTGIPFYKKWLFQALVYLR